MYYLTIFLTTALIVGGSTYYVKTIKDTVDETVVRQQELLDNQVAIYNATIKEMEAIVFFLGSQDGLLDQRIQALSNLSANADEKIKQKINEVITSIQDKHNKLAKVVRFGLEKPTYEYLKSVTTFHFRRVAGAERGFSATGAVVKITDDFTYIITNKHVIDGCPDEYVCEVVDEDENTYPVEIIKISESDYDLALVRIPGAIPGKQAIKGITDGTYQERVFMVGHNLGRPYLYSEGTISGYDEDLEHSLVVGMPTAPGNSGSAVFNQHGELVGLIWGVRLTPVLLNGEATPLAVMDFTHGLAVDGKVIKLFLSDLFNE